MSKLYMATALPLAAPAIVHMQAYANGLTALIPTLYDTLDIVSRELIGFIPSVSLNANGAQRVAVGQTITWPKSATITTSDVTASMTLPNPADRTPGVDTMTITKSKKAEFNMTGEEQLALNSSVGYNTIYAGDFAQALRALANEIETDIAVEAIANANRATGTAGTTPFGSDIGATADLRKILDDNGAPPTLRSLIINTATAANMRKLCHLNKVNEAGASMTLRQGELDQIHNFSIKESAGLTLFTKGTNNGAASTNNAGYAIGATVITLAAAGTGTIKAGDVITFAGDLNKYVVGSGDVDVSNGGTITLNAPGLRQAIPAANTVITTGASYMPNVGFSQDAIRLLARPPAKPAEGDLRIDEEIITDPRSGLSFEVSVWPGQRMVAYQVALAWGVKAVKEENIALLLG
jgi:hypothetical protein